MKKFLSKKVLIPLITLLTTATIFLPVASAGQARDYNPNSVIYGGAYSITELTNKVLHGTGQKYQSSTELTSLFTKLGMGPEYFDDSQMKSGTVYKDGRVVVNGRTVWTNAQSMGRNYIPGSTQDKSFPYPVYWRPTHVSFNSNSIPAYVYMNDDGSMAFAIIKSCGNPVKGVGVKYNAKVLKWIDANGNKAWDKTENTRQKGVKFTLTGNGITKIAYTDSMGYATFTGLKKGTYTIIETVPAGYRNTTGNYRKLVVENSKALVTFGNQKIEATYQAYALKWIDANGNKVWDKTENTRQKGVKFTLTGNGITKVAYTDSMGYAFFNDLKKGTYKITETIPAGYKNTTGITKTIVVDRNKVGATFGNQQVKTYSIIAKKFEDCDGDKVRDANEKYLEGWKIKLTGPVNKEGFTDKDGKIEFKNLPAGTYKVSEETREGWKNITPLSVSTTVPAYGGRVPVIEFGNQKVVIKKTYKIIARKYEDVDGDAVHDSNERWIEGWAIKLSGNNQNREFLTDAGGQIIFTNLQPGVYTITEATREGWKNITPISKTLVLPTSDGSVPTVDFGNQQIKKVVPPAPQPLPITGPEQAAGGMVGLLGLLGSGKYYLKGKKGLKVAKKKIK